MAVESLAALELSTVIVKLVAKLWFRDSDFPIDSAADLGSLLAKRINGKGEQRAARRTFERMADEVEKVLDPFFEVEFGGLPVNEKQAATLAVVHTASQVQIDEQTLLRVNLNPLALEEQLREADPGAASRNLLSSAATVFYDRLLAEVAVAIVELGSTLPRFDVHATAELLRREGQVIDLMQKVVENLPKARAAAFEIDPENFEIRYARAIASYLDRLELFGVTVSEVSRRYRLSVAYITLSATATGSARQRLRQAESERDDLSSDDERTPSLGALASAAEDGLGGDDDEDLYLRIDDVLADSHSCLIRGEAGSGKTTLLQWLAVRCANRSHRGQLKRWNDLVPFFIQLRRYAGKELPRPEQFLDFTAPSLIGMMPANWVHAQLESGRALLLVDGVDELPARQRSAAHAWLAELQTTFPNARYVVTSRPAAVSQRWLSEESFEVTELQPMEPGDIMAFIDHWHDAAVADIEDSSERDELDAHRARLKDAVRGSRPIRKLATLPLLCAMLCALNRDRKSKLPEDRLELYRIALETLLDRRDIERDIPVEGTLTLGLPTKELLLRDLAYWLMRNAQTDAEKAAAIHRIGAKLALMPHVKATATETIDYLLVRSGILREPVDGRIDFIHRTFQEYLAAKQAVAEYDIAFLVKHAHEDNWREVIILAAGHAELEARESLISGLLKRGHDEPKHRHLMHLLAVACLETSTELSPGITLRLRDALGHLVPPSNMTEARALASAGELAVPLLAEHRRSIPVTACAACIRTLALIGGEPALDVLSRFGNDRRVTVVKELLRAWRFFDPDDYARLVLANAPFPQGLVMPELAWLPTVKYLNSLKSLRIEGIGMGVNDEADLAALRGCRGLTGLELRYVRAMRQWDALGALDALEALQVLFCGGVKDIEPVRGMSRLHNLALTGLDVEDLEPVRKANRLRTLVLGSLPRLTDLSPLEGLRIEFLNIYRCDGVSDLAALSTMTTLRELSLRWLPDVATLDPLANAELVENLMLGGMRQVTSVGVVANMPLLRRLQLRDLRSVQALEGLEPLGRLSLLDALDCRALGDVSELSHLESLATLRITNSKIQRLPDLSRASQLEDVRLSGNKELRDIEGLATARRLRRLTLLGCRRLKDLEPLGRLRALNYLDLEGCVGIRDLEPIVKLPRLRTVDVTDCSAALDVEPLLARGVNVIGRRSRTEEFAVVAVR